MLVSLCQANCGLTGPDVNVARLDLSQGVFGDAFVGLCVNLLAVILGPKWWQKKIAIWQNLQQNCHITKCILVLINTCMVFPVFVD